MKADSPAIDKGNNFGSTTDQRGLTRPVDNSSIANAADGNGADIGAFEVQTTPAGVSSISGTVSYGTIPAGGQSKVVSGVLMSAGAGNSATTSSSGTYVCQCIGLQKQVLVKG